MYLKQSIVLTLTNTLIIVKSFFENLRQLRQLFGSWDSHIFFTFKSLKCYSLIYMGSLLPYLFHLFTSRCDIFPQCIQSQILCNYDEIFTHIYIFSARNDKISTPSHSITHHSISMKLTILFNSVQFLLNIFYF